MHCSQSQLPQWERILGLALCTVVLAGCAAELADPPRLGDRAPGFTLKNLDDETTRLRDLTRDSVVLVNFWATWCAPCKAEIPILNNIYRKYKDQGLHVVGISVEEKKPMVANFSKRFAVAYPVLLDADGKVAKRYGVFSYPKTYILDRDGTVLASVSGMLQEAEITATLERLLGPPERRSGTSTSARMKEK